VNGDGDALLILRRVAALPPDCPAIGG